MFSLHVFQQFAKEAGVKPPKGLLKHIKPRDLAAAGTGAAALYTGRRLAEDIAVGERLRRQQQQGGY